MKTRKLTQILDRLIDKVITGTSKVTDFTPGSAIRSLLEAVSLEIEQFYVLTKENINWGIQEGIIEAFDFNRRKPRKAYGDITLTFYNPLESRLYIPKGTTFMSSEQQYSIQYETLVDYYAEPGSTNAVIEVYAKLEGEIGNVPEGTIDIMTTASAQLKSVTNELSFSTGQDEESIEELKNRFHMFVESRGRATNKSIRYGTLQVPDVEGVYVYEEVGRVLVYAHDRNGNLSDTLKEDVRQSLEDYRPSGIKLDVVPVNKITQDVSVTVTISNKARINDTLRKHIEGTIRGYLNNFNVSDDLVVTDLTQLIMNIDDSLIYDLSYGNIVGNIETRPQDIIRAGQVNVTLI